MRVTTCLDLQGLRRGKEEVREREDEGNKRNWADTRKDSMGGIVGHS